MAGPPDAADTARPAPRVLRLDLWARPGMVWHARLVDVDAGVHEFDSPFELARFLAHPQVPPARDGGGGLR